jgi:GNAT superfamily N-acetyltransferase
LKDIEIRGYYPGVIGKITELHAVYYHENWGFDVTFETQVGRELSAFMSRFDEELDGFWVAVREKEFAGSIAIDGAQATTAGARLRWFIVDPQYHGSGIGSKLMARSIEFCRRKGFPGIYLWTFKGLESARRLYESAGFRLSAESRIDQWGQTILEQKYELVIGS